MASRKAALLVLLLAPVASAAAAKGARAKETPIQKVIQLLDGMIAKGQEEMQKEQVDFSSYKAFCDSTTAAKQNAIKEGMEKMEGLTADIAKAKAEAEELGKEIAVLDGDISTWEGDLKAAAKVREIENIDYQSMHKDYTESIKALEDGVNTVSAQNKDVPQSAAAAALMQLQEKPLLTEEAKRALQLFIGEDAPKPSLIQEGAPEAKAFESNLQGIIDMLTGLTSKFKKEKTALETKEQDALQAYQMLAMDLKSQVEAATSTRTEKSEKKASALQAAADAESDFTDTSTTKDDDSKYVSDLIAECELTSGQFADRQALRVEEIEAIGKAKEILSSGAVAGAGEKHLPQLIQQPSLAQLRAETSVPNQVRVAAYLKEQAGRLNSRVLALLATRAAADPFKKVKKMIKDLIVKLMEEATEEAETKGFCDKEMSTNEHTRKEKTAQVETLSADIDGLDASVATLAEEISELTAAVAELDAAVTKATNIRTEEKKKNTATIKDAQDAQTAVAQALAVLKEFYAKSGKATALEQEEADQKPDFSEPYKGMGGASGGVVGMIEVIESDFARLESETTAAEADAAKQYKTFMNDSKMDKMQKSKDIEHKTETKEEQANALQEKKSDLAGTEKELGAAMEYYEKLKPTCVSGGQVSYEDRVKQRKEEIESLQEALRILSGEDIA